MRLFIGDQQRDFDVMATGQCPQLGRGGVIVTDDHHGYLALLRQCLQQRQFPQAGGAPGREVVDQERLASKLRQCDRLALAVAELGGRGAGCQQSRHNQPTNSFHFLCPAAYPDHPFPLQ